MDPLTQATIGAAAAAMVARRPEIRRAIVLGALAGAAPDLDVLIRSDTDPLLALEYHRHFTHSLWIAPLIGLLVAALFKGLFFWKDWAFGRLALFAVIGVFTHGLIDACTSYGTLLYWPLSDHRESWDIISIIDPIFTLPLCLLTLIAFAFRRPTWAQLGIAFCTCYLLIGVYQHSRAKDFALELAQARGQVPEELTVRPSFGNIVLWRIIYRSGDQYYVDAVRTTPFSEPRHYPGGMVDAFDQEPWGLGSSVLARDIERFRFFSQGYLYRYPGEPNVLGDLRYAMFPDSIKPLWGIRINLLQADMHTGLEHFRNPSGRAWGRLWSMILGEAVPPLNRP